MTETSVFVLSFFYYTKKIICSKHVITTTSRKSQRELCYSHTCME